MCGIVGFLSKSKFHRLNSSLSAASSRLAHRGPDDSGLYANESDGIGLAHRRLSIIDLSAAGRQPMTDESNTLRIVYNGEIYNFKQIRASLEKLGYRFRSETDTEVILKAYRQWGPSCLEQFVGMFALAVWDEKNKHLFLARDRIGIKPLYYFHKEDIFLFASELKALVAFDLFPAEIDPHALSLFLHYQYIPAPKTVFRNTYKLMPGCFAFIKEDHIEIKSYWSLPERQNSTVIDEKDALNRLDCLMTQAVSDRLISDVPLGALLSGGIDSSLIVAMMQKVSSTPVKTFTIGFCEHEYDEAIWASKIAAHLGTSHTELFVTPQEARNVIPQIPEVFDEPFADVSAIPTLLVSRLARSKVTTALSGDGGDEQFAGYVRYWTTLSLARMLGRVPRSISPLMKSIPPRVLYSMYRSLLPFLPQRLKTTNFFDKFERISALLGERKIQEIYRMTICIWTTDEIRKLAGKEVPQSHYENEFGQMRDFSPLYQIMHVDRKTYLPDAMLTKVDRASMSCGLEVRVPLLDHRVVEFSSQLPDAFSYRDGTGKYLLKRLLEKYLPKPLFARPKMGFGVPMGDWFRKELKDLVCDYLSPARLKRTGWFDAAYVEQTLREHLSGRIHHQYRLWSLLVWEMWAERRVNR